MTRTIVRKRPEALSSVVPTRAAQDEYQRDQAENSPEKVDNASRDTVVSGKYHEKQPFVCLGTATNAP